MRQRRRTFIPSRSSAFNSTVTFQSTARSVDAEAEGRSGPLGNMRSPRPWATKLAGSLSDCNTFDELEAYRVREARSSLPSFVGRPTLLLGSLAVTALTAAAAARWMMLVTRWVVEWSAVVAGPGGTRRDKLYFKMVVRIITAATICADRPAVSPLDVRSVPPPPPPPPPRSMRAEKGS